jgi:hypothetical protein
MLFRCRINPPPPKKKAENMRVLTCKEVERLRERTIRAPFNYVGEGYKTVNPVLNYGWKVLKTINLIILTTV